MSARFEVAPGGEVRFFSPYSRSLVDELKRRVPVGTRRWDAAARAWVLDPAQVVPVADICQAVFGRRPPVPAAVLQAAAPVPETRLLCVEYVGAGRERPDGTVSASGWADLSGGTAGGDWSVVFPVDALRSWFEPGFRPPAAASPRGGPPTYYALLGLAPEADPAAIKAGYRRAARSVHPDVNREPDAADRFIAVQRAYDVLSDASQRRRYDAALRFEAQTQAPPRYERDANVGYRAPLPCGWVLAEGRMRLGRFVVARIVSWEDIVEDGKVLVSTWPPGADAFERHWVPA